MVRSWQSSMKRRLPQTTTGVEISIPYFDAGFYQEQYRPAQSALKHYETFGIAHDYNPNPLFDTKFYLETYPDISGSQPNAYLHFLEHGQTENRMPHPLFDIRFYASAHKKVCKSIGEKPFNHFMECEIFTAPTPLWMPEKKFEDERETFLNFLKDWRSLGVKVNPLFSYQFYLNSSINRTGRRFENPLVDYSYWSAKDKGSSLNNPCEWFNESVFFHHHQEIEPTRSLLSHFLMFQHQTNFVTNDPVFWNLIPGTQFFTSNILKIVSQLPDLEGIRQARSLEKRDRDSQTTADLVIASITLKQTLPTILALSNLFANLPNNWTARLLVNEASELSSTLLPTYFDTHQLVEIEDRISYSEANNLLSEITESEFILFLNDDVHITQGAIQELLNHLRHHPETVAVGLTIKNIHGQILESGGKFSPDGQNIQLFRFLPTLPGVWSGVQEVDYVSGAVLMVRRSAFFAEGGFSVAYEPVYYEDVDLCLRLRKHGKIEVLTYLSAFHEESRTTNQSSILPHRREIIKVNRQTFINRFNTDRVELPQYCPPSIPTEKTDQLKFKFYTPYGFMLGGGEQYFFSAASALSEKNFVGIEIPQTTTYFKTSERLNQLGIDPFDFQLDSHPNSRDYKYDYLFEMGNSLTPSGKFKRGNHIFHCQFPFPHANDLTLKRIEALKAADVVLLNSEFTKSKFLERAGDLVFENQVKILYPPCRMLGLQEKGVERLEIISIGRFFSEGHSKRQDLLITAFRQLFDALPQARLTLAGSVAPTIQDLSYLDTCRDLAKGLPVEFVINPDLEMLDNLTRRAHLYWHGTGLDVEPGNSHQYEHFGIAIVQAMSAGVVPLVFHKGGPMEIIETADSELSYIMLEELVEKSLALAQDDSMREKLAQWSVSRAQNYNRERFRITLNGIIDAL